MSVFVKRDRVQKSDIWWRPWSPGYHANVIHERFDDEVVGRHLAEKNRRRRQPSADIVEK